MKNVTRVSMEPHRREKLAFLLGKKEVVAELDLKERTGVYDL